MTGFVILDDSDVSMHDVGSSLNRLHGEFSTVDRGEWDVTAGFRWYGFVDPMQQFQTTHLNFFLFLFEARFFLNFNPNSPQVQNDLHCKYS